MGTVWLEAAGRCPGEGWLGGKGQQSPAALLPSAGGSPASQGAPQPAAMLELNNGCPTAIVAPGKSLGQITNELQENNVH